MTDYRRGMEQMFPTLTPAQIARIAAHGRVRRAAAGEVLVEAGEQQPPFFVVAAGELQVVRPGTAGEELVTVHHAGRVHRRGQHALRPAAGSCACARPRPAR